MKMAASQLYLPRGLSFCLASQHMKVFLGASNKCDTIPLMHCSHLEVALDPQDTGIMLTSGYRGCFPVVQKGETTVPFVLMSFAACQNLNSMSCLPLWSPPLLAERS
jgi:hypothetical protein